MADESSSQMPTSDGQLDGASAAAVSLALAAATHHEHIASKAEALLAPE